MLVYVLYACLVIPMAGAVVDDWQYCAIRYRRLCQGKGKHVACQFPESGPGASCENYTDINFNDEIKRYITHYINRRRQRIASGNEKVRGGVRLPKPQVMMLVEWDRELAFLAQRLADQCYFVHDDCRATVRYPYAGQTVGEVRWRKSSDSEQLSAQRGIRRVLDAWWGEKRRVLPKQLTSPFRLTSRGAVWGHFTQLAVWNLRAVGCGAVRHGMLKPRLLLVCDFSHTNMLGQKTISPGYLAPCPMHTIRRPRTQYPLLCATVRRSSEITGKQYDDYEEDDNDSEELVQLGEVITSTAEVTRKRTTHSTEARPMQDYKLQAKMLAPKKTVIVDKIEKELVKKKDEDKTYYSQHTEVTYRERITTRKYYGKWRDMEIQEGVDEQMATEEAKTYSPQTMRRKYPKATPSRIITYAVQDPPARLRWKQTYDRRTRPGPKARLIKLTAKTVASERKHSAPSLVLDKDDVDQLFKDTGFNLLEKKRTHQNLS